MGNSFVWRNLLATIFQLLRWELTQGWAPPAGIWSPGSFVSIRPKLFSLTSRMCRIPRSGVQSFFSVFTQISPVGPTWWKLHKSSKFWSNLHLDGKSWWGRILLEARLGSLLREQVWFWTGHLEQCYTSLGVYLDPLILVYVQCALFANLIVFFRHLGTECQGVRLSLPECLSSRPHSPVQTKIKLNIWRWRKDYYDPIDEKFPTSMLIPSIFSCTRLCTWISPYKQISKVFPNLQKGAPFKGVPKIYKFCHF